MKSAVGGARAIRVGPISAVEGTSQSAPGAVQAPTIGKH